MLARFTVGNFLSFNKNQTLSLIAGEVQKNKARLYQAQDMKLLKFGSIYGANASGKSNLVKAMSFALKIILTGTASILNTQCYYRLVSENREKPSYFEFEICINKKMYAYGFELNIFRKEITEEWLIELGSVRDKKIFYRNTRTGHYTYDDSLLEEDYVQRFEIYISDIRMVKDKTFLNYIIFDKADLHRDNPNLVILKQVFDWFSTLAISFPDTPASMYDSFAMENPQVLEKAIGSCATGISHVVFEEIPQEKVFEGTPMDIRERIKHSMQQVCAEPNRGMRLNLQGRLVFVSCMDGKPTFKEVFFVHGNLKGQLFSLGEESDGTQRVLDLLTVLVTSRENSVFVIEEIDRSLHPQLTVHFIRNFLKLAEQKDIQLVVTTHESHLLDLKLLRQDEIFFVEKDSTGSSTIFPFDKFKERFDKRIEKAYLDGRYGAVPLFDSFFMPEDTAKEK
ncbi:MAG TPA: transporter [Sphaerochaeta sp.]|nr:transporter [Sphaerochaeta sp.]